MLHSMETEVPGTAGQSRPAQANRRRWPTPLQWAVVILLIATLSLLIALMARSTDHGRPAAADLARSYAEEPAPQGPTTSLTIDFGNGAKHEFTGMPWEERMTVGDLMHAASLRSPGLNYKVQGSGEMTLLTSLDGVANGAGDGRYWLYEINGRHAKVSFAVQPLSAGDRVLWSFKKPE